MGEKAKYLTEYISFNGKYYKIYGKNKIELKQKVKAKLEKLYSGSIFIDSKTVLDDWANVAFDTYKKGHTDYNAIKSRYKRYVSPYIGHIPVSKITATQCQTVINNCNGMSYSHCNKLKQELSFLFKKAMDDGIIAKNPAAQVALPKVKKGTHRSITDEERECLYKVYKANNKFLPFIIMLECGCRSKESTIIKGEDIDHNKRLLHIRGTKTDNADRYVGIPDDLYETIKNTPKQSYICLNNEGRQYNKKAFYRLAQRLYREMNIELGCKVYRNQLIPPLPLAEDFEPYCLRHTYCTDLCKAGVDVRTAQKLMGHANIAITAEIYTHVDQSQIIDANAKMNTYLNAIKKEN